MSSQQKETDELIPSFPSDYRNRFHAFYDLMKKRVNEVLLVSSFYDDFILEEDGHLTEQIFRQYGELQLSSPPRITRVSTPSDALDAIDKMDFDLVITMRRIVDSDPFSFGSEVKEKRPNLPVILLLTNYSELSHIPLFDDQEGIDRVFVWNGDSTIFVAIIKLVEDQMNLKRDTTIGMVRVILVIEDSIQYYSLFLPAIYSEVVHQTQELMDEGLNRYHQLLQMRARPKIILATTFEEGMEYYQKYKDNILGVITDVRYPREGETDLDAGIDFINIVHKDNPFLPTLLQSSNLKNKERAKGANSFFLHKVSPDLIKGLKKFMKKYLGFGYFSFCLPDGTEVARAESMVKFEKILETVPAESILYHGVRNHFSNWLLARGEHQLASILKPLKVTDFQGAEEIRSFLKEFFYKSRYEMKRGIIAHFSVKHYELDTPFVRIGEGSLGGKGRGLAFVSAILSSENLEEKYLGIEISIPNTIVIGTGLYDQFIEENELFDIILQDISDRQMKEIFLSKSLPDELEIALKHIADLHTEPLAVRSSSLLEDSQFQPFAGIYATYMLPNNGSKSKERYKQLEKAVKLVYASTVSRLAKNYIRKIGQKIEVEKMAIVIQKVIGQQFEERFYPDFSGVAQSYNYYPISYMKPEDGITYVALGLGAMIVEGGSSLRFCPKYPKILPQISTLEDTLKNTQSEFFALRINENHPDLIEGENITLETYPHTVAHEDGTTTLQTSTYDIQNERIVNRTTIQGPKVLTFAPILKQNRFPLCSILEDLLQLGQESFACPVEIEFAVVTTNRQVPEFKILQMRPLISETDRQEVEIESFKEEAFIYSDKALGNGVMKGIKDIVYVKREAFNSTETLEIKKEIAEINSKLSDEDKSYVLIGPGRWGTRDRFLGIPVDWSDIYYAKVLIEAGLADFKVDPSQGMHFFVNVTSTGMGYFTIPYGDKEAKINWEWLDNQIAKEETKYLKHLSFEEELVIRVNGKIGEGVISSTKVLPNE